MRASGHGGQIVITVDRDELLRMAGVMAEALNLHTRSEFYIRTGCAKPNMEELVRKLRSVAEGATREFDLDIPVGVEVEENPPRPRR